MDEFSARFSVATARSDGATVVTPVGELDLATAPQLARALAAIRPSTVPLVLDLRRLGLSDDGGLDALCSAVDEAGRPAGGPDRREPAVLSLDQVLERLPILAGS